MRARALLPCIIAAALAGCGSSTPEPGEADAGNNRADSSGTDAPFGGGCVTGGPQCANCSDDDADGH